MFKYSEIKLPNDIKVKVTKIKIVGSDKWYTVDFISPSGTYVRVSETLGFFESHAITHYSFDGRA